MGWRVSNYITAKKEKWHEREDLGRIWYRFYVRSWSYFASSRTKRWKGWNRNCFSRISGENGLTARWHMVELEKKEFPPPPCVASKAGSTFALQFYEQRHRAGLGTSTVDGVAGHPRGNGAWACVVVSRLACLLRALPTSMQRRGIGPVRGAGRREMDATKTFGRRRLCVFQLGFWHKIEK
jgi:hypothetical protein